MLFPGMEQLLIYALLLQFSSVSSATMCEIYQNDREHVMNELEVLTCQSCLASLSFSKSQEQILELEIPSSLLHVFPYRQ